MYFLKFVIRLDELSENIIKESTFRHYDNVIDSYMSQKQYEGMYHDEFNKDAYNGWFHGISCALDNIRTDKTINENIINLEKVRSNLNLSNWRAPYMTLTKFYDSYDYVIDFLRKLSSMNVNTGTTLFMDSTVSILLSDVPGDDSFYHNVPFTY